MNHSGAAVHAGETAHGTITEETAVGDLLGALDDRDCRAILTAASEETLSASELSERCDLPLSTTYRKLNTLTGVGLLDEQIRLRGSDKHTSEYSLAVETIELSVDSETGVEVVVSREGDRERSNPVPAGAD
jgi:DNA-binding transcriptional ArsR family regulator